MLGVSERVCVCVSECVIDDQAFESIISSFVHLQSILVAVTAADFHFQNWLHSVDAIRIDTIEIRTLNR